MKVRLSTVQKNRKFVYRGNTYTMLSLKPSKNKVNGSTFRWVKRDGAEKASMFTVNGNVQVSLVPNSLEKMLTNPVPTKSPRVGGRRVVVSKGKNTYRVTAKWWNGTAKKYDYKVFMVNADDAASAVRVIEGARAKNSRTKVTYTVARVDVP